MLDSPRTVAPRAPRPSWLVGCATVALVLGCLADRGGKTEDGARRRAPEDAPRARADDPLPKCAEVVSDDQYRPENHPFSRHDPIRLEEPVMGRTFEVVARIPVDVDGPLPVVIWSHGGDPRPRGAEDSASWGQIFAAAGYAAIHVGHTKLSASSEGGRRPDDETWKALCSSAGIRDWEACRRIQYTTISRPLELLALMDHLDALSEALSEASGRTVRLDASKIALAGWSAGTVSIASLSGFERYLNEQAPRFNIPGSKHIASVWLSPGSACVGGTFCGKPRFDGMRDCRLPRSACSESSWDGLTSPTLVVSGEGDCKKGKGITGDSRKLNYEMMPAGNKSMLYLPDDTCDNAERCMGCTMSHGTFNLGDCASDAGPTSRAIVSAVTAYLDAKVRDRAEARAYLASDKLEGLAPGAIWETP